MVNISSFSDRINFLNFKHSVSELPIFDFVLLSTQMTFFFSFSEEEGGKAAILCLKIILCIWLSCVC